MKSVLFFYADNFITFVAWE